MSKELRALERIKKFMSENSVHWKQDVGMIEDALKDYERRLALAKEYKDVNNVGKRLKAFEIIKNKRVDVNDFLTFVDLKSYNEWVTDCDENKLRVLTEEEYKLLKEMLA